MTTLRQMSQSLCTQSLSLRDKGGSSLTPLQCARVEEIRRSCDYVQRAVHAYEIGVMSGGGPDPRARLMYAARTPLSIIDLATHLLRLYHARSSGPLNEGQRACLLQIETASRDLVREIERLWTDMQRESKPNQGTMDG